MVVDYSKGTGVLSVSRRVLEWDAKSVDITLDYGALGAICSLKFTQPHSTRHGTDVAF